MAALGLDLFQADHDLQEQRNVSSDSGSVVGLAQGIGFHIQGVELSDGDLLSGELSQGELPDVAAGAVDRIISFWHSQRQAVLKNKQLIVNTFECRLINMPLAASNIFLELPQRRHPPGQHRETEIFKQIIALINLLLAMGFISSDNLIGCAE